MNRIMLLIGMLLPVFGHAQTEKRVDSKITGVTVFLARAQVTRHVTARAESGRTDFIIHGLTSRLDPLSIQVTGKGKVTILGISHQQNFLNEFNMPPRLKALKDSVQLLQEQIQRAQNNREIVAKEEQMILSNQKIGGANQNLSVQELKAMADFFRSRLGELAELKATYERKITLLNETLVKVQKQFREQNELVNRNTSEVVIRTASDIATNVEFELSYVVTNAGWNPTYDLRAVDTSKPVQLQYKANVYQSTGEEWKNVKLKLSTGNPSLGGSKPQLMPWFLNFPQRVVRTPVYRNQKAETAPRMADSVSGYVDKNADSETAADYTEVVQTSLNTEFVISIPYTVASAGKPTQVDIASHSMNASYEYFGSPKLDQDAFLTARVTNWEEYNLLPGEANIFMDGTFVGRAFIDPNQVRDTLSFSLGRDKRIVVQREKVKDFSSRKFIGSNQREAYAYEISVRNTRLETVSITIEDQIPVSQNNQIEVALIDGANATYTAATGRLEWKMTLKPQEQRKVIYKFEVKYPKDQIVPGL